MQVYHLSYPSSLNEMKNDPVVIAIGYFDGVHIGHQKVIATAKKMADQLSLPLAVMTFHPHPKEVLYQSTQMKYLTPLEDKIALFEPLGVKKTFIMQFDHQLANLSAQEFVEKVCIPLQIKGIVTGFNFRFGKMQSGNPESLQRFSQNRFETETVPAVMKEENDVSSTWIRQLLDRGEMEQVTRLLGRYYRFQGCVEHGDKRGRMIGFPTANLQITMPYHIPKRGVYIVRAFFEGTRAYGLMNIGVRPTFHPNAAQDKVEVHLFDTNIDLYGKAMTVDILHFLRPERKFTHVDALIQQIQDDKSQAEKWLSAEHLFT